VIRKTTIEIASVYVINFAALFDAIVSEIIYK
jgi:hypothetical protein